MLKRDKDGDDAPDASPAEPAPKAGVMKRPAAPDGAAPGAKRAKKSNDDEARP